MKFPKITTLWLALAFAFYSTLQCFGYITPGTHGESDGIRYSSSELEKEAPSFGYWKNVVHVGSGTGIYVGAEQSGETGYVVTANHLGNLAAGGASIKVAGTDYDVTDSRRVGQTDLAIHELDTRNAAPELELLAAVSIADYDPQVGDQLLTMGRGSRIEETDGNPSTSDAVVDSGFNVFHWNQAGGINWAFNNVDEVLPWQGSGSTADWTDAGVGATQNVFFSVFNDPGAGNYDTSFEGTAARGDSGGPAFIVRDGGWQLAGITSSVLTRGTQPANTSAFGNRTSYVNLAEYSGELPELWEVSTNVPEPGGAFLLAIATGVFLTTRRRG